MSRRWRRSSVRTLLLMLQVIPRCRGNSPGGATNGVLDDLGKVITIGHTLVGGKDGLDLLEGICNGSPALGLGSRGLSDSLSVGSSVLGLVHSLRLLPFKARVSGVITYRECGGGLPGIWTRGQCGCSDIGTS